MLKMKSLYEPVQFKFDKPNRLKRSFLLYCQQPTAKANAVELYSIDKSRSDYEYVNTSLQYPSILPRIRNGAQEPRPTLKKA